MHLTSQKHQAFLLGLGRLGAGGVSGVVETRDAALQRLCDGGSAGGGDSAGEAAPALGQASHDPLQAKRGRPRPQARPLLPASNSQQKTSKQVTGKPHT